MDPFHRPRRYLLSNWICQRAHRLCGTGADTLELGLMISLTTTPTSSAGATVPADLPLCPSFSRKQAYIHFSHSALVFTRLIHEHPTLEQALGDGRLSTGLRLRASMLISRSDHHPVSWRFHRDIRVEGRHSGSTGVFFIFPVPAHIRLKYDGEYNMVTPYISSP